MATLTDEELLAQEQEQNPFTKPMLDQSGAPIAQQAVASARQAKLDEALKKVREQRLADTQALPTLSQADKDQASNENLARSTVAGLSNALNFTGTLGGPKQESALSKFALAQNDSADAAALTQQKARETALTQGRQDRTDAQSMLSADEASTLKNNQDARLSAAFAAKQAAAKQKADPNSEESKAAVQLAERYTKRPGAFTGKSAAQLEATLPGFAKVYEIDQKNADRRENRQDKQDQYNQTRLDRLDAQAERNLDRRTAAEDKKLARDEKDREGTASQNTAAGYAMRMEQAENVFDDLAANGYSRADTSSSIGAALPGFAQTTKAQQQEQAEKNFLIGVLRKESGASISPAEFSTGAAQYFPRSGDSPETIAQKKRNRQQSTQNFKAEAGKALEKYTPILKSKPVVAPKSAVDLESMSDAELEAYANGK